MNRFEDISEIELDLLAEHMNAGRYYLLLGSGVSLDSKGPDGPMRSANTLRSDLAKLARISANSTLQQAYSLLDPEEIDTQITQHYDCRSPGNTVELIASIAWRRIYTLNVDNCLEVVLREIMRKSGIAPETGIQSINYVDDYVDLSPEVKASIVHLHGSVERAADGYVFSREEYAKLMSRPNSWMLTLTQLLKSEPFVVSGTSLDEVDVSYYLEQRGRAHVRSDVPPSILVEPCPNRLTEHLCNQHGFYLFEGTAQDFIHRLEQRKSTRSVTWSAPHTDRITANLHKVHQLQFAATFERVPKNSPPDASSARFLLGSPITWEMLAANIDVSRTATSKMRAKLIKAISERQSRVFLILEEAGSGKTSILKRLAYDVSKTNENVFWYKGTSFIDEEVCADVLDRVDGRLFIFVDNFADSQNIVERLLRNINKTDIIFVGAERSYRLPYIESGMADEEFIIAELDLGVDISEAVALVKAHEDQGISSLGAKTTAEINTHAREIVGQPVSVAVCRIQNNYKPFDKIVDELLTAAGRTHRDTYATAAIARFCHAGGVRRQVLMAAVGSEDLNEMMSENSPLPLVYNQQHFVTPRRSVVGDRVVSRLIDRDEKTAMVLFANLANALAPYVTRDQIRRRSPESRLAGRLMDFDQVVKRLINNQAEGFYELTKENWSWNSRYWEQMSLLKLDRFLIDMTDEKLLEESIQHARHAYAIEQHPLSLTTLAKVLFEAMVVENHLQPSLFEEAWNLIKQSIEIEMRWDSLKATAFVVCFRGVINYVDKGGILSGDQAATVRDFISVTYSRKLKDRRLGELREAVSTVVNA
jgi:hypothetical protein